MNEEEVLEPELEEIEPEALSLDELDESVEGSDGYNEEEVHEYGDIDPFSGEDDLDSEEDPTE